MARKLSPREKEVLMLLAEGLTNREIANQLGISWRTVDAYLRRIYNKIDVKGRVEAAIWCQQNLKKGDVDGKGKEDT